MDLKPKQNRGRFPHALILRSMTKLCVSKDGPQALRYTVEPSRRPFPFPQEEAETVAIRIEKTSINGNSDAPVTQPFPRQRVNRRYGNAAFNSVRNSSRGLI
jgi:hypothetical protein